MLGARRRVVAAGRIRFRRNGSRAVTTHSFRVDGSARNHRLAGRTGCLPIKPKRPGAGPTSAKATAPGAS